MTNEYELLRALDVYKHDKNFQQDEELFHIYKEDDELTKNLILLADTFSKPVASVPNINLEY